jgi:hypothetical protein
VSELDLAAEFGEDSSRADAGGVLMKGNPLANYPAHYESDQTVRVQLAPGVEQEVFSTETLDKATGLDVVVSVADAYAAGLVGAIVRIYQIVNGAKILCPESVRMLSPIGLSLVAPSGAQRVSWVRNRVASYFVVSIQALVIEGNALPNPKVTVLVGITGHEPHAGEPQDQVATWLQPPAALDNVQAVIGTVRWLQTFGMNAGASLTYVGFYDMATKPGVGDVPLFTLPVDTNKAFSVDNVRGRQLMNGLYIAASTSPTAYVEDVTAVLVTTSEFS